MVEVRKFKKKISFVKKRIEKVRFCQLPLILFKKKKTAALSKTLKERRLILNSRKREMKTSSGKICLQLQF